MQHVWYIGWFWFWVGVVCFVGLILPLFIARGYRLAYAAILSGALLLLLGVSWWRGLHGTDDGVLAFPIDTASERAVPNFLFASGDGGVQVAFHEPIDSRPTAARPAHPGPTIGWFLAGPKEYPQVWSDIAVLDRAGFQVVWANELDRAGGRYRHVWQAVFPAWFPMPFLLIMPALYTRRVVKRMKVRRGERRLTAGRCPACDFDLRGTPLAADGSKRCGECGTVIPALPKPAETAKP